MLVDAEYSDYRRQGCGCRDLAKCAKPRRVDCRSVMSVSSCLKDAYILLCDSENKDGHNSTCRSILHVQIPRLALIFRSISPASLGDRRSWLKCISSAASHEAKRRHFIAVAYYYRNSRRQSFLFVKMRVCVCRSSSCCLLGPSHV